MINIKKPARVLEVSAKNWEPVTARCVLIINITPKLASRMLEFNTGNRPLSQRRVLEMVREMKAGNWKFTNQGIGFSHTKVLMDGQHRLSAICQSGVSVECEVTFGLDPSVFPVIDTRGMSRSASDLLGILRPDSRNKNSACAVASAMMKGLSGSRPKLTIVAEFADWYYELISSFIDAFSKQPSACRSASLVAGFVNAARGLDEWPGGHGCRDPEMVMLLAMRYGSMEWDGPKDPLKVLYQKIVRASTSSGELTRSEQYAYTVHAVRLALQGKTGVKAQKSEVEWGSQSDHGAKPRVQVFTGKDKSRIPKEPEPKLEVPSANARLIA